MRVIIPAGGKSTRFGGILKELLPISKSSTPLLHTLWMAYTNFYSDIVILSNTDKILEHVKELTRVYYHDKVYVHINHKDREVWDAIYSVIPENQSAGIMLPDTVTEFSFSNVFHRYVVKPDEFILGLFTTSEPNRFSIFTGNEIITKPNSLQPGNYTAWGVVFWGSDVSNFLINQYEIHDYDTAFNQAIKRFGVKTFMLDYYYDLGTFEAYIQYLKDDT
jgi:hypothetical protein